MTNVRDAAGHPAAGNALDGGGQRPAQQPQTVLGDTPAGDLGIGFAYGDVEPAHEHSYDALRNGVTFTKLGHDPVATPGRRRAVARSTSSHGHGQQSGEHLPEHDGLGGQLARPGAVARLGFESTAAVQGIQPTLTRRAEDVRAGHRDPGLASTPCA